ncbi:hypothetical protein M432DRAFT_617336 [Thermoascus aurantiacus ATCC 26904]
MKEQLFSDKQCGKCGERSTTFSYDRIRDAPEVLLVQINRFSDTPHETRKVATRLHFDEELQLDKYLQEHKQRQGDRLQYELYGIIFHEGKNSGEGHYYAVVRGPNGQWTRVDDSRTKTIPFEDIKRLQDVNNTAYIFAYMRTRPIEKIAPQSSQLVLQFAEEKKHVGSEDLTSLLISGTEPQVPTSSTDPCVNAEQKEYDKVDLHVKSKDQGPPQEPQASKAHDSSKQPPAEGQLWLECTVTLDTRELRERFIQPLILPDGSGPFVQPLKPRARGQPIQFRITLTSDDTKEVLEGSIRGYVKLRKSPKAPAKPASARARQTRSEQEMTPKEKAAPKRTQKRAKAGSARQTGIIKPPPATRAPAKRTNTVEKAAGTQKPRPIGKTDKVTAAR